MDSSNGLREMKDLSLDLFMGTRKNPKYYDERDAKRNAKIMGLFSKELRRVNKECYRK